jgi:hypothetical protein
MIKSGHGCQRADKKETDLAKTQQEMTQYDSMTKPDLGLKTARVPISRLHYNKTHHRDGKVLRRTCHFTSGSQLPIIRERIPEKHLSSHDLCDDRTPELRFVGIHLRAFQQLRTIEPRHRKFKASDNSRSYPFCISMPQQPLVLTPNVSTI